MKNKDGEFDVRKTRFGIGFERSLSVTVGASLVVSAFTDFSSEACIAIGLLVAAFIEFKENSKYSKGGQDG